MRPLPRREHWAAIALGVAAVAGGGGSARAEDNVVYEKEPEEAYVPELRNAPRKLIGFDFGIGIYDAFCGGCNLTGGLSVGFSAGLQVTSRLAAVGDLWSLLHLLPVDDPAERGFTAHSLATASARVWVLPTLWVQAGGGAGFLSILGARDDLIVGPAGTVAVGGELKHRPGSGIDVSLRIGTSWFPADEDDMSAGLVDELVYNVAGAVGYHWN